ncbi:MAG: Ricin and poly(3-hydroxybutyrate) depolymerase fusion [Polyangiaceae bacterium]|nr:Ricin and poly(3-hydroxybutyrate) depolymerase fusion [Polyangiaceae bacterium]
MRALCLSLSCLLSGTLVVGCSSDTTIESFTGVGGELGTGGDSGIGGATIGGSGAQTGGITTGGTPSGGVSSGGTGPTGGQIPTLGGSSSGGTGIGGSSIGGLATGGGVTGGTSGGGSGTGGMVTGGTTTGGASTGGSGTGGVGDGGTGGSATGGTSDTGGAATGGKATGGATTGGHGGATGGAEGTGGGTGDPDRSSGCGTTSSIVSGDGQTINVGGSSRKYNLKLPDDYDNNHPYRLIVSYHWLGGSANDVSHGGVAQPYYGLWDLAEGSTVFVAPDGLNNAWNNSNGADVEFSRQLIAYLEEGLCIDKSRIFCEGFSMGGSMSYAMACAAGDIIRAVAAHSGGPMSGCVGHDEPVAYFMTHGTNDSVCTYPQFGVPQVNDFAETNGCTAQSMPTPSGQEPSCIDFAGCQAGYPVRACIFVGDHTPSPAGGWVPQETWDFLSQF